MLGIHVATVEGSPGALEGGSVSVSTLVLETLPTCNVGGDAGVGFPACRLSSAAAPSNPPPSSPTSAMNGLPWSINIAHAAASYETCPRAPTHPRAPARPARVVELHLPLGRARRHPYAPCPCVPLPDLDLRRRPACIPGGCIRGKAFNPDQRSHVEHVSTAMHRLVNDARLAVACVVELDQPHNAEGIHTHAVLVDGSFSFEGETDSPGGASGCRVELLLSTASSALCFLL